MFILHRCMLPVSVECQNENWYFKHQQFCSLQGRTNRVSCSNFSVDDVSVSQNGNTMKALVHDLEL